MGLNQVPWLILLSTVVGGILYGIKKGYPGTLPEQCWPVEADGQDLCCDSHCIPFGPAIALAILLLYLARTLL